MSVGALRFTPVIAGYPAGVSRWPSVGIDAPRPSQHRTYHLSLRLVLPRRRTSTTLTSADAAGSARSLAARLLARIRRLVDRRPWALLDRALLHESAGYRTPAALATTLARHTSPPFLGSIGASHAYCVSRHVTARLRYGGIRLPLAIGAVVVGWDTTAQTPLSGQISPVRAVVPIGAMVHLLVFS